MDRRFDRYKEIRIEEIRVLRKYKIQQIKELKVKGTKINWVDYTLKCLITLYKTLEKIKKNMLKISLIGKCFLKHS